jgi:hypothetical protein
MALQHLKTITVTPTVDTLIYASGDLIGGLLTFDGVRLIGGAVIKTITLVDQAKQNAAIDLILFGGNLSGTTLTNNGVLDVADADLLTYLGHVSIPAANYAPFNDNSAATVKDINLYLLPAATGTAIYGLLVSRGTPTYAASTDLQLSVTFARE